MHVGDVRVDGGMAGGQLRETLLKKPLLYIRWVAGDGYVRGLRIIGHIDVIVTKNPLATTRCAGRKSEMSDWNGPGNFSHRQPRSSNRNPLHLIGAHLVTPPAATLHRSPTTPPPHQHTAPRFRQL